MNAASLVTIFFSSPFTFHRAFDEVTNTEESLEQLINLGVHRVLTSGQKSTAETGIELLNQLIEIASDKIIILPGSGINRNNARLFKDAGYQEIHASASTVILQEGSLFFKPQTVSDVQKIKAILDAI